MTVNNTVTMYSRRDLPNCGPYGFVPLLPDVGQAPTYFGNTYREEVWVKTLADFLEGPSITRKPRKKRLTLHLDDSSDYRFLSLMRRR